MFDTPVILDEAIVLPPTPVEPFQEVLTALQSGITDALGLDFVRPSPSRRPASGHTCLAYNSGELDSVPYGKGLDTADAESATV